MSGYCALCFAAAIFFWACRPECQARRPISPNSKGSPTNPRGQLPRKVELIRGRRPLAEESVVHLGNDQRTSAEADLAAELGQM